MSRGVDWLCIIMQFGGDDDDADADNADAVDVDDDIAEVVRQAAWFCIRMQFEGDDDDDDDDDVLADELLVQANDSDTNIFGLVTQSEVDDKAVLTAIQDLVVM